MQIFFGSGIQNDGFMKYVLESHLSSVGIIV